MTEEAEIGTRTIDRDYAELLQNGMTVKYVPLVVSDCCGAAIYIRHDGPNEWERSFAVCQRCTKPCVMLTKVADHLHKQ